MLHTGAAVLGSGVSPGLAGLRCWEGGSPGEAAAGLRMVRNALDWGCSSSGSGNLAGAGGHHSGARCLFPS